MIPVLLVFPNVGWETGWGKVISTLAQTNAAYTFDQEPLDYLILSRFSPQEAMGAHNACDLVPVGYDRRCELCR